MIELCLHPTNAIIMELLEYGSEVKIIEPESMQNKIHNRAMEIIDLYSS